MLPIPGDSGEPTRLACKVCGCLSLEATLLANQGVCMACARAAANKALFQLDDDLSQKLGASYISNPGLLPRNKNTSYRKSVLTLSLGIAEAFDEMKLTEVSLVERFKANPEHFYMVDLDLTETGQKFARMTFDKWVSKTERWKPESRTIQKFKESLAKEFKAFERAQTA